jgi:hypothetical protein
MNLVRSNDCLRVGHYAMKIGYNIVFLQQLNLVRVTKSRMSRATEIGIVYRGP